MHNKQLLAIVDDDDSVRVATSRLVRSLGWEVILFDTATAFLNSGCAAEVDCVISDVQMPGITGIEMHRRLTDAGVHVPVIFITAFSVEATRRQAMKNGALSFLNKPVDGAALQACLDRIGKAAPSA